MTRAELSRQWYKSPGLVLAPAILDDIIRQGLTREVLQYMKDNQHPKLRGFQPHCLSDSRAKTLLLQLHGCPITPVETETGYAPPWATEVLRTPAPQSGKTVLHNAFIDASKLAAPKGFEPQQIQEPGTMPMTLYTVVGIKPNEKKNAAFWMGVAKSLNNTITGAHTPNQNKDETEMKTAQHEAQVRQILDLEGNHKFVSVAYGDTDRLYTYKTALQLEVGDTVLVERTFGALHAVTVAMVDVVPKEDLLGKYKWIVSKVDRTEYDKRLAVEQAFVDTAVNSMVRRDRQLRSEAMVSSLDMSEQDKTAFMQSLKNLGVSE